MYLMELEWHVKTERDKSTLNEVSFSGHHALGCPRLQQGAFALYLH